MQAQTSQYRTAFPTFDSGFKRDHSFSLSSLKDNELCDMYDCLDRDSDTETTMTTATTATNNTIHNIRYGGLQRYVSLRSGPSWVPDWVA